MSVLSKAMRPLWIGVALVAVTTTGCQVSTGGQTLPSPYYMADDVQYFPPGPEFKLQREANAQAAARAQAPAPAAPAPR